MARTSWLLQSQLQWTMSLVSLTRVSGFQRCGPLCCSRCCNAMLSVCLSLPPSPLSFLQTIRGSYISWFSGEMFTGGDVINRNYTLSEMPLFVRSGSIIPMRTNDFGRFGCLYQCNTFLFLTTRASWISSADSRDSQTDGVCWRCSSVCSQAVFITLML